MEEIPKSESGIDKFLNRFVASEELQKERFDKCRACDNYLKSTKQCKICWCFVKLKVKVKGEKCPDPENSKW